MSTKPSEAPPPGGRPPWIPKDNGFRYRPQFGVIVLAADEAEHRAIFEDLKGRGLRCRPVSV